MDMRLSKLQELEMDRVAWCAAGRGVTGSDRTEWLNWTEYKCMGFPAGSVVKNWPAVQEPQETRVQSLGWEDPVEEEMTTLSSILAWRIPRTEEPGWLQSMGTQSQAQLNWLSTQYIYIYVYTHTYRTKHRTEITHSIFQCPRLHIKLDFHQEITQ